MCIIFNATGIHEFHILYFCSVPVPISRLSSKRTLTYTYLYISGFTDSECVAHLPFINRTCYACIYVHLISVFIFWIFVLPLSFRWTELWSRHDCNNGTRAFGSDPYTRTHAPHNRHNDSKISCRRGPGVPRAR